MTHRLNYTRIEFPDHTHPKGALPRLHAAQACWYFYLLAHKIHERVGKSTEDQFGLLDGELWMDKHYVNLARSIAMQYGLESPDEFAKHWDSVRKEARACQLPEPHPEYTRLAPRRLLS
jgi:hypothetical protein